jgi:metal-responsive CopG/Arc/MetJ family transcriptional regulator
MATGNITLPEELLPRLREAAIAENRTADELVAEAVRQHLARRGLEQIRQKAIQYRGNMTDEEVEEYVDEVIHEFRAENRGQ